MSIWGFDTLPMVRLSSWVVPEPPAKKADEREKFEISEEKKGVETNSM
jgi:hypothetical protein